MMVYVLDVNGLPLMPTERYGYVRKLLKSNKAQVVSGNPFTIRLLCETENNTQDIDLKIDAGYQHIGISACTDNKELFSGELKLLENQSKRLDDRRAYRRTRRNRLRYRKSRFDNRRRPDQWLAPSIQHKLYNMASIFFIKKSLLHHKRRLNTKMTFRCMDSFQMKNMMH